MTLTTEEFNTLNKIATKSGMECWFFLKQDANGDDYVYDLEERKRISLRRGVSYLADGFYCDYSKEERFSLLDLSEEEIKTFEDLLVKLRIPKK